MSKLIQIVWAVFVVLLVLAGGVLMRLTFLATDPGEPIVWEQVFSFDNLKLFLQIVTLSTVIVVGYHVLKK